MRITAILFVLGGALGVYGASQYQIPEGAIPLFPGVTVAVGVLADVDDAQRATQRQLADLTLAQRTARGPFHSEVVTGSRPPEGG